MLKRNLVKNLDALDRWEPYDVCVIGSGPAGTIVAAQLAQQGIRTVLLESGNSLLDWVADGRLKGLAQYEVSGDADYPLTRTTARVIGGNSNFWTGRCERFHPSDFQSHAYTPGDNPWPLGYSDLERYYARAEQTLRVRGGELSKYAPPRRQGFPLPPRPNIDSLKRLMAGVGVTLDHSPTATPARGLRFFRVQREILPRFVASESGALVSGVTVTRLLHDDGANIVGAEVKTLDGVTKVARARRFVVCCGGLQSPRLLLLSRSERFPNGIGNSSDRVGRGFNEHPSLNFYSKLRHSRATLDPRHSIGRLHQFYDTCREEGLGAIHGVAIQSWVFPSHFARYRIVDIPKHFFKVVSRLARPSMWMSPTVEMKPQDENRVMLSDRARDAFGNPIPHLRLSFSEEDRRLLGRARELFLDVLKRLNATDIEEAELTWSRHHIGTCRMGDDPRTSVVDRNLRVHECPNLYVCGSEVFVTGAAVQPVLTISAFALRLAEHLGEVVKAADMQPAYRTAGSI